MIKNNNPNHILFLALSGIGNLIMQMPTIKAIKKLYPESNITTWVAPRGTKVLAENEPDIDTVFEAPIQTNLTGHLKTIQHLYQQHFDTAIMLSPGQQLKGSLYMYLAGISTHIAHQYPFQDNPHSQLLLTQSIPEEQHLHDLEQNYNLVKLLISQPLPPVQAYELPIPAQNQTKAQESISALNIPSDRKIIGFHPGSAPTFTWKRWPLKNWAQVAVNLIQDHQAHILIFGGPDEQDQKQELLQLIQKHAPNTSIISSDLLTTAAIIKHCHLFISNDSGLMHLAASTGTQTLGLFGPTDEAKTGPRGPKVHTLRAPNTKPAYDTEQNYNLGQEPHPSIQALTPQLVIKTATNTN